ncbi:MULTISPECIES: phospholipase D-like domain-containing protein [Burkholderia]|uniref:phospholipase D-like domain-containing protein n=1 Tax=Burkholderia TaxID=32008 RepID=UPI000501D889|nr:MULTISPECIES: phospholipase D-like domain-containing protein [Burkholderia]KFL51919.1 cardiolipin synthase [Burkholderia pyrrocinia]
MMIRALTGIATAACGLAIAGGCTSLPDTQFLSGRYATQAARFESAWGPLSAKRSATIVKDLKRSAGGTVLLDKQIALEQAISGSPLVVGNEVRLLQDGPATYQAMFEAMAAAKDHINLETFGIDDSDVGRQFADAMIAQQSRGVQVNLIYDSVGALGTPSTYFDRLRAAGIRVLEFNPVNPLSTRKPWALNHRDHRKLLIVDGRTAFLGGINISSVYSSGSSGRHRSASTDEAGAARGWRDTDVQISGPVVAEFQKLFLQTWSTQNGKPLAERHYFPKLRPQGPEIVRAVGSTPDDPFSLIYLMLIAAISNAEQRVYLTNAYFVPDPQLVNALVDAAKRGVDVRMILPGRSDSALAFYAGRSHYEDLLDAGVKIYERRGALLHAKTAIVDGVWSCVGSSNLDWRSALDNDEINAVVLGQTFAQRMESAFDEDMAASDEIGRESWKHRSLLLRVKEWTARLWGHFL